MMHESPITSTVITHIGPVPISRPVLTTWVIIALVSLLCWLFTRRLQRVPDRGQAVLEALVIGMRRQIEEIIRKDPRPFLPLLGTLFIFLVVANLSGLIPGMQAPTGRIETPAALALIVFFSVHYFGVRARGLHHGGDGEHRRWSHPPGVSTAYGVRGRANGARHSQNG